MNIQFDEDALNQPSEPRIRLIGIPYPEPEFETGGTTTGYPEPQKEPGLPSEPTDEETIRLIERF